MSQNDHSHSASVAVAVGPQVAFAFLADGMNQSYWALGSLDRERLGPDTFVGTSMFDGAKEYVRLRPDEAALLVDYFVGPAPEELHHLVESRIIPGEELGRSADSCVVTNTVWRSEGIDDETWALMYHLWNTEVHLIKGKLERLTEG